ncbi:MAG: hypothetical protein ACR2NN_11120 [Bryobacteraceae bacterium]
MAAVVLASCQKAPDRIESGSPATAGSSGGTGAETEIPSNTALWVQLEKALDSSKLKVGDHFTGKLAEAIVFNGRDAVPKGATVNGHVTNTQSAQGQGSSGLLSLELDSLSVRGADYSVKANPVTLQSAPLTTDSDKGSPAAPAVDNAFAPKKGILQFFLTEALRVKS